MRCKNPAQSNCRNERSLVLTKMQLEEIKQLLQQMAAESAELKAAVGSTLTDVVAEWLIHQYVVAAREQLAAVPNGSERWKLLRITANDLVALRRGDHSAARLTLERERLVFERACVERNKEAEFWEWTKRPEIKRKLWPKKRGGLTKKALKE